MLRIARTFWGACASFVPALCRILLVTNMGMGRKGDYKPVRYSCHRGRSALDTSCSWTATPLSPSIAARRCMSETGHTRQSQTSLASKPLEMCQGLFVPKSKTQRTRGHETTSMMFKKAGSFEEGNVSGPCFFIGAWCRFSLIRRSVGHSARICQKSRNDSENALSLAAEPHSE